MLDVLKNVLIAQLVEASPYTLGHPSLDLSSGEGISLPWDPKDSEKKVRVLYTIFIKCRILVKKKKSNLFYKWVNN